MSRISIAALQLAQSPGDNRDHIEAEVTSVLRRYPWIQMVVLPELATFGPEVRYAETLPGDTERRYQALARQHAIWLLPGSLYEQRGDLLYNTASVINPAGEVVARYSKMFPFLPYERGITPGGKPVVFDVPGVARFGVSICYDGWFPEIARELVWQGAEVILHPTMVGSIDRQDELVLARATAITNQCYYLDINNAGRQGNGLSIIVGPEGEVVHQAGEGHTIMPVTLDMSRVREVRARGTKGLGQVLKTFRDARLKLNCYDPAGPPSSYLEALGPVKLATREGYEDLAESTLDPE